MRTGLRVCLAVSLLALPTGPLLLAPAAPAPPAIEPLKHEGYTETIPGSAVQFDLVAVPGGTFLLGSPADEKGRGGDEGPRHPVRVRPFWMGKTEVTWDEYDLFAKKEAEPKANKPTRADLAADAVTGPSQSYIDETRGFGREHYPAVGITHHAAMEYCRWLSAKTGKAYRLPTEAEWEHACRAGTRTAYYFGDGADRLGDHAWYAKNADDSTHPVGQKKPNPWGLYDLYGNVAEWCLDQYQEDWYGTHPSDQLTLAPVKLPTAARYPHVVRGGSWADSAARCRSAARRASDRSWNKSDPALPASIWWLADADFVGFRVVRAVEEQEELKGLRSQVTPDSK
jgi:formylglycine-generating enzyme required for sulfatase activity